MNSSVTLFIVSDSTGETAATALKSALVQYADVDVKIVRHKNIRTIYQLEAIVNLAGESRAAIFHTFVARDMRNKLSELAAQLAVITVDLLGPLLDKLDVLLGQPSSGKVGLLRNTDEKYFKRIEAIEFTVKHDDGKSLETIHLADVVLVGISRTSKTPLSIFLSHKGWKVANIPLVYGVAPPKELANVDPRRIVGLIIDTNRLSEIRRKRMNRLGGDSQDYASFEYIEKELAHADLLFKQNRSWPIIDVTERALEETASEISRIIVSKLNLPDDMLV